MVDESLDTLCGLFGKSRQAYYQKINYEYKEYVHEVMIVERIMEIRVDQPKIGGRKLWHILNEELPSGLSVGRDELFDIMERNGLKVKMRIRRTRTTYSFKWMKQWPNLIKGIVPTASNQIWVSDITYIPTRKEGFVYLHLVTDAYSKRIMGWHVSASLHAEYTLAALEMAIRSVGRPLKGLIHHSDRGCQYCCEKYIERLQENLIGISMTESGDPLENAVAERINGILKMEWLNAEDFYDIDQARKRVSEVVSVYNSQRPHMSLNYMTPDEAYNMQGIIPRRWKNYYDSHLKDGDKLLALTSPVRTEAQTHATL